MILIGYARVSTINQNEDRQIQELIKYGVEEKRIYIDKQSGKDFHRPSYMKMLKRLKKDNPDIEKSVFNSIHSVCLDTMPGWKTKGEEHSFLENYDKK